MLFCGGMLVPFCLAVQAQEAVKPASIALAVKDETGASVPNAHVQIVPWPINVGKNLNTDNNGKLSLEVAPGSYELTVQFKGFETVRKHIETKTATHQTIDIVLKLGTCPQGACPPVTNVFSVSFPAQSEAASPDGRYVVFSIESGTVPYHSVFLQDMWQLYKTPRKLLNYDRSIVLLWRYDSKLFAVTDYFGSDSPRCSIFSVDEKVPPIQVLDVLSHQLSADTWRQLEGRLSNHRAYVEAVEWETKSLMVKITLSGYGNADPKGFADFYTVLIPVGQP
jgi:hypothetical protein